MSEVAHRSAPRASCDSVLLARSGPRATGRRTSLLARSGVPDLGEAARAAGAPLTALEPVADELARATVVRRHRLVCGARPAPSGCTTVSRARPPGRVGESVLLRRRSARSSSRGAATPPSRAGSTARCGARRRRALPHRRRAAARERGYTVSVAGVHPDLLRMLEDLADHAPDPANLDVRDALIGEISPRVPAGRVADDGLSASTRCRGPSSTRREGAVRAHGARPEPRVEPRRGGDVGRPPARRRRAATERIGGRHPEPRGHQAPPVPDDLSAGYWAAAAGILALRAGLRSVRPAADRGLPELREHRTRLHHRAGRGRRHRAVVDDRARLFPARLRHDVPYVLVDAELDAQSNVRMIGRLVDGVDARSPSAIASP